MEAIKLLFYHKLKLDGRGMLAWQSQIRDLVKRCVCIAPVIAEGEAWGGPVGQIKGVQSNVGWSDR